MANLAVTTSSAIAAAALPISPLGRRLPFRPATDTPRGAAGALAEDTAHPSFESLLVAATPANDDSDSGGSLATFLAQSFAQEETSQSTGGDALSASAAAAYRSGDALASPVFEQTAEIMAPQWQTASSQVIDILV